MNETNWEPDHRLTQVLGKLLSPGDAHSMIEVGCGLGSLSLWFASRLARGGKVRAFDSDPSVLEVASRVAKTEGLDNVSFEPANVYNLPVPDQSADLVICKNLLSVLAKIKPALQEMLRVLQVGGSLVAIEPGAAQCFYDPDDPRFAELSSKLNRAFHAGWRRKGANQQIGMQIPSLFFRSGLEEIAVEAVTQIHVLCDHRRSSEDVIQQLETEASRIPKETVTMLLKGGISRKNLKQQRTRARQRLSDFASHLSSIRKSGYTRLMSPLVITVGKKL